MVEHKNGPRPRLIVGRACAAVRRTYRAVSGSRYGAGLAKATGRIGSAKFERCWRGVPPQPSLLIKGEGIRIFATETALAELTHKCKIFDDFVTVTAGQTDPDDQ